MVVVGVLLRWCSWGFRGGRLFWSRLGCWRGGRRGSGSGCGCGSWWLGWLGGLRGWSVWLGWLSWDWVKVWVVHEGFKSSSVWALFGEFLENLAFLLKEVLLLLEFPNLLLLDLDLLFLGKLGLEECDVSLVHLSIEFFV